MAEGPDLWMNWRAYDPHTRPAEAFEAALYSDTDLVGTIVDRARPVDLMSAIPPVGHGVKFSAVARVRWNVEANVDLSRRDTSSYHGGGAIDEVAALVSLALGVRCRSGGITRRWLRGSPDPLGMPMEFDHRRPYLSEQADQYPLLPNLPPSGDLADCIALLDSFAVAEGSKATALIRAARLYQHALWVAEDDPNLSWLELISSLEAATLAPTTDLPPGERLAAAWPSLWAILLDAGEDHAAAVAAHLADLVKSTARFLEFMDQYSPDPPAQRPSSAARVDWSKLSKYLRVIYDYRSKSLHSGLPFPQPMCSAPFKEPEGCAMERPFGLSTGMGGTVWMAKDLPMHLHIFAHITRGALLNWWRSVTEKSDAHVDGS